MVADRVMRGSRLGAVSYETDRNHNLAPRQNARVNGQLKLPVGGRENCP